VRARGPGIPSAARPCAAPGATSLSNGCLALQRTNLRSSDCQTPVLDNADHARTSLVTGTDALDRCGLVLDVGGCSG
jgi:hypothetical protein